MTERFSLCVIIPTYRQAVRLPHIIASLKALSLPVIVVDDGNEEPVRSAVAALKGDGVSVVRLDQNGGKGAAVKRGFTEAHAQGHTHALQIDADGQHDLADVPAFIAHAQDDPTALICGAARYDESAPGARKYGRYVTHFWVWVETLSFDIEDSMCGFRIYPLAPTMAVLRGEHVGDRMDFDTDIIVHLHWRRVPVITVPTRVIYPLDNTSNFQMLADNVRISLMHTRLALQMPFRVPWKLIRYGRT